LVSFFEVERRGVDAVAQAGWLRAVLEDVAQVGAAVGADDLGAPHEPAVVLFFANVLRLQRFPKAGPAAARIIFRTRAEQRFAATDAAINAFLFIVQILARKGPLRPFLSG